MRFRRLLLIPALALSCLAETPQSAPSSSHGHDHEKLRGRLTQRPGLPPAVETSEHKLVTVEGEEGAIKVLADERLHGAEVEATGHFTAPDRFVLDPNHARTVFAR